MTIAEIFRGDRGRLVSGIACQVPDKCSRILPQILSRLEEATGLSPPARSFPGMESIGSRLKRLAQWILPLFSEAIVSWWYCRNHRNSPGNFSKGSRTRKNFADPHLFRGETHGKAQFSDVQKRPRIAPKEVKTVANGAKDCVCSCGGCGPRPGSRRVVPGAVEGKLAILFPARADCGAGRVVVLSEPYSHPLRRAPL